MKNDPLYLDKARKLRREMTRQERHLWYDFLRNHKVKFYKQKPYGPYILDFYCPSRSLAIELDGSQHYEVDGMEKDETRNEYLAHKGVRTLRFSDTDIDKNFEGVCSAIEKELTGPLSVTAEP